MDCENCHLTVVGLHDTGPRCLQALSTQHNTTVCYSVPELEYLHWKKPLFENGINQRLIKQLKVYSAMWYFIITCKLSPNFKVALIALWFLIITCANPLVWYDCQGKQPPVASELRHCLTRPGTSPTGTGDSCFFIGCLTSQQHASVSQGRICSDNFTCCHTEIEVADQTFHLTQSKYTDTGPTSLSVDPITSGAWQGSHWSANV